MKTLFMKAQYKVEILRYKAVENLSRRELETQVEHVGCRDLLELCPRGRTLEYQSTI